MRFLILAIVAVALVQGSPADLHKSFPIHRELENPRADTFAFEGTINNTLECVRNILVNGDEELGIPSIEPLEVANLDLNLDNLGVAGVSGKLSLKNFKFVGLTNFRASHLKGTVTLIPVGMKLEITMLFPSSSFEGSYSGDVLINDKSIKGEGSVSGALTNMLIPVKLQAALQQKQIKLKSFSFKPSIESLKFHIDNVLVNGEENSELINSAVEGFPQWLKDNNKEIDAKVSKLIMDAVNNMQPGEGGEGGGIIGDIITIIQTKCKL